MMNCEPDSNNRETALDGVLAGYMERIDRGERVDEEELIAAHPELATELREYFSQVNAVANFASGLPTLPGRTTSVGGIKVRCPKCQFSFEVASDTSLDDLECPSCGKSFSLVQNNKATWSAPFITRMGRFELIDRLGVGGFGTVWKARDNELDRTVAIKIPRQGGMTREEQEKFLREARAAAQLRHPNIVSVHEVGRDGDSVYIVSDFVRGVTLGEWRSQKKPAAHDAARLCAKIADALHHAHEQGVVHRDLKPANIMIDARDEPHLMDFGLARRETGESTVTMEGQILGTPAYMSPEQAQGDAHTADRRTDVYSLGVILFQLLTGELPFRGSAREILRQVISDEPPCPRRLNPEIPAELEVIAIKCLHKSPSRRYATTQELADSLHLFCAQRASYDGAAQQRLVAAAENAVAKAVSDRHEADDRYRRLESALHYAIGVLFDGPARHNEMPWERMERIIDSAAKCELSLPRLNLVTKSTKDYQERWRDARKQALMGQVHVMAGDAARAISAAEIGYASWQAVFGTERTVDIVTLEILTIAAARIPGLAAPDTRKRLLELLSKLFHEWNQLQYPSDFRAVGLVYVAEGFQSAGDHDRAAEIAKRAIAMLNGGRYPSSLIRAKQLVED